MTSDHDRLFTQTAGMSIESPYRSTELILPPRPSLARRAMAFLRSLFTRHIAPGDPYPCADVVFDNPKSARYVRCDPCGPGVTISLKTHRYEATITLTTIDLKWTADRLNDIDFSVTKTFAICDYVGSIHLIPEDLAQQVRDVICTCAKACR